MVDDKWDALLKELSSALQDVATMVSSGGDDESSYPFADASFRPTDGAQPMLWLVCLDARELLLSYGDGRARWELDWSEESVQLVKDVARAVCTGRSKEVRALGRIYVEVSLPDGSTIGTGTYEAPLGLIPLPGWRSGDAEPRWLSFSGLLKLLMLQTVLHWTESV